MIALLLCTVPLLPSAAVPAAVTTAVPVLLYHRLGPAPCNAMTVTPEHFREQLDLLAGYHYTVIPLSALVAWRLGHGPPPPPLSVVLTFDDGFASVYTNARPILLQKNLPATLFVYPAGISSGPFAMSWQQLTSMASTPLFSVESHTYRHPNFRREMHRQTPAEYTAFVDRQLSDSRIALQQKLNRPINVLAWPFGIYNAAVVRQAGADGYVAGFAVDCRAVTLSDNVMELPRCMISDRDTGLRFLALLDRCYRFAGKPIKTAADHTDTSLLPQYGRVTHPDVPGSTASSRSLE